MTLNKALHKNPSAFLPASTISERSAVTLLSDAADVAYKVKKLTQTSWFPLLLTRRFIQRMNIQIQDFKLIALDPDL